MLITTRNSVYRLCQDGDKVALTLLAIRDGKTRDFPIGSTFRGDYVYPVVVGKVVWVGGLMTSSVEKVVPEKGDEAIRFIK